MQLSPSLSPHAAKANTASAIRNPTKYRTTTSAVVAQRALRAAMYVHQACHVVSPVLQWNPRVQCAGFAFGAQGRSGCARNFELCELGAPTAAPQTSLHRSEHESRLCQVPLDSAQCSNVRVPQAVSVTLALAQQNAGGNYPNEAANP